MADDRTSESERATPAAHFLSAAVLYSVASAALERTRAAQDARATKDALVAIVFAAASLEAFIGELPLRSSSVLERSADGTQGASALSGVLEELEQSRGSVALKYQLARLLLCGAPYDKGAMPYQDFSLLIDARNSLVHMKPERAEEGQPHRLLRRLQARGLCRVSSGYLASWMSLMRPQETARWACTVAYDMVQSIADCLGEAAKSIVTQGFKPVE